MSDEERLIELQKQIDEIKNKPKTYGYARVSTYKQAKDGNSLEAQEQTLLDNGAEIIFKDAYTGTKISRPQFDEMLSVLKSGDKVIVTKLDRIARSASSGLDLINDLLDKGISIHILNMGLLDNTPSGKLIRTIMLAFAEFERNMIVERTQEGKSIARQREDFKDGRPPKYSREQISLAMELLERNSINDVVKKTGISRSTLIRYKKRNK